MNNSSLRVTTINVTSTNTGTMEHFHKITCLAINTAPFADMKNIFKGDLDVLQFKRDIRISLRLCQMRWRYDERNKTSMFTNTRHVKAYVVYGL
jgi:hypothetical protein